MSGGPTHMGPLPVGPRLTRRGAQQQGQQCQAEALHGRRQHALREPERGAGAADRSPLGGRPGREKPQSEDPTPRTLPFSDPGNDHSPGITGNVGGGSPSRSLRCPTPKPSPRASTITVSLPGKRNLPSLVRWLPEVLTTFALHLREQGVFSPQGAVGASGQERREEEAHLTCRRGRGARRVPVLVPTPGLGGREPRTESPPLVPARAPRRSPLSGAWSAGLRVGGALTSLGCQHSGISSGCSAAREAMPFGLPADRNRGAASSFGERSRRRGPRARGGAESGRGPRARWGDERGGGAWGWRPSSRSPYPAFAPFARAQRPL